MGRSSLLAQDCCQPFQSPRRITHKNCHSPGGNNFPFVPRIWAVKAMAGQELSQGAAREGVKPDVKERKRRLKGWIYPCWDWSVTVSHELTRGMSVPSGFQTHAKSSSFSEGWQLPAVLSLLQSPAWICCWLGSEVTSRGTQETCRSPG